MRRKWKFAAAGVAVLALVGAGAAYAGLGRGQGHARIYERARTATFGAPSRGAVASGFGLRGELQVAADYLGVSVDTLVADLRSGKTLAQEAQAQKKDVGGLVDALVAGVTSRLDAARKAGKLTQSQEDAITAKLKPLVSDLVNGTAPAFPFRPGGVHHGRGLVRPSQGGANA